MKIPKIIHYCWFGDGEMPEVERKCLESWKEVLKDYEFVLWNETNFDLNTCPYVRDAYKHKKYAFVSDYARVKALYDIGGIYLDTDVEVLHPFDPFIENEAFLCFENKTFVGTAVMGAKKNALFLKKMLEYYNQTPFIDENGNENLKTNVTLLDSILVSMGMTKNNSRQNINGIAIFERDYFFPKKISETRYKLTDRTITIHRMSASWLTERQRRRGTNKFWISICRPTLRFLRILLSVFLGNRAVDSVERIIRNIIK